MTTITQEKAFLFDLSYALDFREYIRSAERSKLNKMELQVNIFYQKNQNTVYLPQYI